MDLMPLGLVNVEVVKFLRRLFNPNGAQNILNRTGFYVDLMPYIEMKLGETYPGNDTKGLFTWIKNNPVLFFEGKAEDVTREINNYLLLDPYVLEFLGFSIPIYTDPYHLRQYAIYAAGVVIVYKLVTAKSKRKRK